MSIVRTRADALRGLLHSERTPGVLMLLAMALALAVANSSLEPLYAAIHHAPVHLRLGPLILDEPAIVWVNEGLMVFFFLVVGLDIKRQLREGALASPRRAALPLIAALGGMAAPALVYLMFTAGDPALARGWAIPTATDIVLAVGVLSFLGSRVSATLKIFLTAVAIFDDLGGVLLIGLFYGGEIARAPLAVALLAVGGLMALNGLRVVRAAPFVVLGIVLWVAMLESGIPAALAGVAIAFAVPLHAGGASPARQVEHRVQPWVAFLIIPAFGFFNAGITIQAGPTGVALPILLGVAVGLALGKPVGIAIAVWLATRLRLGEMPEGVTWRDLIGVAFTAGVGFTVSLYIASLAFRDPLLAGSARLGVLSGSVIAAVVGLLILGTVRCRPVFAQPRDAARSPATADPPAHADASSMRDPSVPVDVEDPAGPRQ